MDIQDSPAVIQWNLENPQLPVVPGSDICGARMGGMLESKLGGSRVVLCILYLFLGGVIVIGRWGRCNLSGSDDGGGF